MAKHIIFCADGTWNDPDQDENHDHMPDPTNVFKLFLSLAGRLDPLTLRDADEQEKILSQDGVTLQVAKYLHGVGDSRNPIIQLLGGAFGAGVISRVVRGYTFISRHYTPGDDISIVGFSRGAYTARALAGLIVSQGLLAPSLTQKKELAYRRGAEAWYRYRKAASSSRFSLAHLAEIVADLPAFLSSHTLRQGDLIPVDHLAAVAVWDTVGALGFPEYAGKGKRVDAFKFADTKLSPKVRYGLHAVSLDERRNDFAPTLWESAPHVTQRLFPGAHADVGGGYPTVNRESGLSDGALHWMIERLRLAQVQFAEPLPITLQADPAGTAHKPWAHGIWPHLSLGPRRFPPGLEVDPSIAARQQAGPVRAEPDEAPAPYAPTNRPTAG